MEGIVMVMIGIKEAMEKDEATHTNEHCTCNYALVLSSYAATVFGSLVEAKTISDSKLLG